MLISSAVIISMVAVSAFVAYVMFNILESSAEANLQNWKFGGAFAGFAFTLLTSGSLALQFYKQMTFDEIKSLRNQIIELSSKLIRGAPCPENYVPEVYEKYKLVFARPDEWLHRKGVLYEYEETKEDYAYPTYFSVLYYSKENLSENIEEIKLEDFKTKEIDLEKLYDNITGWIISGLDNKINSIKQDCFEEETESNLNAFNEKVRVDNLPSRKINHNFEVKGKSRAISVQGFWTITYVPNVEAVFIFQFNAESKNFMAMSEVFNNVVNSIRFLP